MSDEIEPGFLLPENVPGQSQSRIGKKEFEAFLESPLFPADIPEEDREKYLSSIHDMADAYWKQLEFGENNEKWDWRKNAFIAWSCVPKSRRWPKTINKFAEMVNIRNTSSIRKWRAKDPEIDERISLLPKMLLRKHVVDVFDAMVQVASDPIPQATAERKLFLEIAGVYNPKGILDVRGLVGTVSIDDVLDDDEQAEIAGMMREMASKKQGH